MALSYLNTTTELEAVNEMLRAIGEAPVSALDDAGPLPVDVETALNCLRQSSREVQTQAWHFNTEDSFPLPVNTDGEIPLPANTLRVKTQTALPMGNSLDPVFALSESLGRGRLNVVQRGSKLYDKDAHSYTFATGVEASLVFLLPWNELPEYARYYILVMAIRKFQTGVVGSETLDKFSALDERQARALMMEAEADTGDYNILTGTLDIAQTVFRY